MMLVPITYVIYIGLAGIVVGSLFTIAAVPAVNRRAARKATPRFDRDLSDFPQIVRDAEYDGRDYSSYPTLGGR